MQQKHQMAHWVEGFDPALIAQRIERAKSVSQNGGASFSGFDHTEHVANLISMLNLNREIPETECRKIINRATFAAAAIGIVTKDSLLKQVGTLESEYLGQTLQKFRLVTNISLDLQSSPKVFKLNDSRIAIGWKTDKKTATSRAKLLQESRRTLNGELPAFYTPIAVNVSARSKNEAATKALDDLDLLRGIWNLWKNRGHTIRLSSGARSPVNQIILGPIHTLHKTSGELATDSWWYETGYRGPVNVWRDAGDVPKMLLFTKSFREHLGKLPYREDIASALIRYARALDSRDWNYTFLQLWSVLELLTGTAQNDSHKDTIKRASFVFSDTDYAMQTLLHLRAYRNKSIHTGSEAENIEPLMYQLKRVVEALLEFHAAKSGKFQKMAQAVEFMNSSSDRTVIDEKIRKLQAVRKFLVA